MNAENPLEDLRELIFGLEKRQLEDLLGKINNPVQFAKTVRQILPAAFNIQWQNDKELSTSLFPYIESALHFSIKNNPGPVSELLYPVMGPAIRKAVADAFSKLLLSVNQALEKSISVNRLKWRLESIFTQKTYAEILLYHNPIFRVERIFLIHRQSGVLLMEAVDIGAPQQNADLITSMLRAIQDFVQDSFNLDKEEDLEAIRVGKLSIYIEQGPNAIIASVLEGNPTEEYREKLKRTIEKIHADYFHFFNSFDGNTEVFKGTIPLLRNCIEHTPPKAKRKPFASILLFSIFALFLIVFAGIKIYESSRYRDYIRQISALPGVEVIEVSKAKGDYHVRGLKDKDAADPYNLLDSLGLSRDRVFFHLRPYQSLDPGFILKRAYKILKPDSGVLLNMVNDTLVISGKFSNNQFEEISNTARLIPGISYVQADYDKILIEKARELKDKIESYTFNFEIGKTGISAKDQDLIDSLSINCNELNLLMIDLYKQVKYQLLGYADTLGISEANQRISYQRATTIAKYLADKGIPNNQLVPVAMGSEKIEFSNITGNNRMVIIKVIISSL